MIWRALIQKRDQFIPQFSQTAIAFHQLLPHLLVFAQLDKLADRLPQPLDRQRKVIGDEFRPPNPQLGPTPASTAEFDFRLTPSSTAQAAVMDAQRRLAALGARA